MHNNLSNIQASDVAEGVEIRYAGSTDAPALERLRQLDSGHGVEGTALLAEADGVALAALELGSGRVIADPFRRTVEVIELLRVRAGQLVVAIDRRPRRSLSARLRPRRMRLATAGAGRAEHPC
jgi:hypothetical protein